MEKGMPFVVYLPLAVMYLIICLFATKFLITWLYRIFFRGTAISIEEIRTLDEKSIQQISLEVLHECNEKRGDDKLTYGNLIFTYWILNLRTEFAADDTFSQKTACWVHIYKMMNSNENYSAVLANKIASQLSLQNKDDDEDENYGKMTTSMQGHFKRATQMRNSLNLMCYLSLITSCLALGQIFSYLVKGERILVLCTAENALLRLCFVIVVLLIVIRDIQ